MRATGIAVANTRTESARPAEAGKPCWRLPADTCPAAPGASVPSRANELPLQIAIQQSGKAGLEPVKMMLDAGADPNAKASFGDPIWWAATGKSSSLETLTLLLDRGADINGLGKGESTVLFDAATTRNWPAVLLLLQRGADWRRGKSVNGLPFRSVVEGEIGSQGTDSAYQAVRRLVQQAY